MNPLLLFSRAAPMQDPSVAMRAAIPVVVHARSSNWESRRGAHNPIWFRLTHDDNCNSSESNYYKDMELENPGPYAKRLKYEVCSVRLVARQ